MVSFPIALAHFREPFEKDEFRILRNPEFFCFRCAMALLHSRIRRVFYGSAFPSFGGLGSKYKIHCLDGTNHHFEVFSGLLETECNEILRGRE